MRPILRLIGRGRDPPSISTVERQLGAMGSVEHERVRTECTRALATHAMFDGWGKRFRYEGRRWGG